MRQFMPSWCNPYPCCSVTTILREILSLWEKCLGSHCVPPPPSRIPYPLLSKKERKLLSVFCKRGENNSQEKRCDYAFKQQKKRGWGRENNDKGHIAGEEPPWRLLCRDLLQLWFGVRLSSPRACVKANLPGVNSSIMKENFIWLLCVTTWDSFPPNLGWFKHGKLYCFFSISFDFFRFIPAILNKWLCWAREKKKNRRLKVWMLLLREEEVVFHLPLSSHPSPISLFIPCEPIGSTTVRCYCCRGCTTNACHNVARPVGLYTSRDTLIYFHCWRPQTMWLNTHTEARVCIIVVQTSVFSLFLINLPPWCCESELWLIPTGVKRFTSYLNTQTHTHTHLGINMHLMEWTAVDQMSDHIFSFLSVGPGWKRVLPAC